MTRQERQGWVIVAGLFVTLLLVFGSGNNASGVFVTPLLRHFGWSHAQVSSLPALLAVSAGVSGALLIGWLLDRLETRAVMVTGVTAAGVSLVMASRANSYPAMLVAYAVLGVGIAAATYLPASMVIAKWFGARRGLAMGIAMSGTTAGGMLMTLVASYVIAHGGWRLGYQVLAVPIFVVAVPLVWMLVRTGPQGQSDATIAENAKRLPGLELGPALRTRSFWAIAVADFCFAFTAAGCVVHIVTYLIGIGYHSSTAALAMSMVFASALIGKILMGVLADRLSGRTALGFNFAIGTIGLLFIFGAVSTRMLALFVIVYGLTMGAPMALLPLMMAESLGLKRFGTLGGLIGVARTLGAALGPVIAGRIFDVTRSYAPAFELFIAILVIGASASFACLPLSVEESRSRAVAAVAAA